MTSDDMLTLLERERYNRGMTLFEFSDEIGISMSSYVHWVYRNQRPKADNLFKAMENAGFEIKIGRKEDGLSWTDGVSGEGTQTAKGFP